MSRISIGRAVGDAFEFTFERYPAIFGVVWLPIVLILAGEYFIFAPYVRSLPDFIQYAVRHPHDQAVPPEWYGMNAHVQLLNLMNIFGAIWIRVGVTKAALDLPRGPHFAYFFLGKDELRVVGAFLVYLALIYGAVLAAFIVMGIAAAIVGALIAGGAFSQINFAALRPWFAGGIVAVVLAFIGALIYVQARLVYLLVPVTVVEKRFGLWRSWELSRGNFWRIVVVAIGTVAPLVLLELILFMIVYVPVIVGLIFEIRHHPEIAHNRQLLNAAVLATLMKDVVRLMPFGGAIGLLLAPVFCGLMYSPSAFAYRSLTGKPD